jgi:hypothetical protein
VLARNCIRPCRIGIPLAWLILFIGIVPPAAAVKSPQQPTVFSQNQLPQSLVPIPAEVLAILLERDEVRQGLEIASDSQRQDPSRLFRAAIVRLRADELDLLVIGVPPIMSNGDDAWFWLVRSPRTDPHIVLFVGASSLRVMRSENKGLADIRTMWAGASESEVESFRFNGREYRLSKTRWTRNRQ